MFVNIVLDLDETLVHTNRKYIKKANLDKNQVSTKISGFTYVINKRPHLRKFIEYVFKNFKTVSIWTAADKVYALHILNIIFTPDEINRLKFVYTRGKCSKCKDSYVKNMNHVFNDFKGFTKENTLLIDDNPDHFMVKNSIYYILPIKKFDLKKQNNIDSELYKIMRIMNKSNTTKDIIKHYKAL
tara:strand:- start:55 stop:609 length:555 start_codon:yes stop_codon:yes gene_type:complete